MDNIIIGERFGQLIQFPVNQNNKVMWLAGRAGSGKTTILAELYKYYKRNNISCFFLSLNTPCTIPEDQFDSILCMFQLENGIEIDSNKYEIMKEHNDMNVKFSDFTHKIYTYYIAIFLFYIINSNQYSIIIIDEIPLTPRVEYLLDNIDMKVIISTNLVHASARQVIFANDCFIKN